MMRKIPAVILSVIALFYAFQAALAADSTLPGEPLTLSAAEKQNLEKFLDHFNWQGVEEYTRGVPRLPSALWDIWVHQPSLVSRLPSKDGGESLSVREKLAADNVLKLYGFPLNEEDLAPGYSLNNGSYLFSDGDGPRDGKTSIDKVFQLANGKLLVRGHVLVTDEGKKIGTPFLAIVGKNANNNIEGYSLEKQISLE